MGPPGHSSIFNPTVTFSPLVEYEFKLANLGVTEWNQHLFRVRQRVLLESFPDTNQQIIIQLGPGDWGVVFDIFWFSNCLQNLFVVNIVCIFLTPLVFCGN